MVRMTLPHAERYLTQVTGVLCFSIPLLLNTLAFALTIVVRAIPSVPVRMTHLSTSQGYNANSSTSLTMGQCIVSFRDAITSILISRFLLDLGALRIQASDVCAQDASLEGRFPSQLSYVAFASPEFDDSTGVVGIE
ncbi:hypothetical protein C8T65DRAFT_739121 [Cerioporus squamosus]|nr:hypothetical protein C8T65DRAFT_739121 [Cerioporus squamosus]